MSSIFIWSIDHPYGGNFRNKFCSRVMTYFKLMKYSFFWVYGVLKFWMLHLQFTSLFHNDRMDVSEYFIGQVSMWFWTNLKLTNPSVTWTSGKRNGEACFCCYYIKKQNPYFLLHWCMHYFNLLPHALCWLLTQIYRIQSGAMHIANLLAA